MAPSPRPPIDVRLSPEDIAIAFAADVLHGLRAPPRSIPPKWLYDPLGCDLFEQITTLDEYYPTRAEQAILDDRASDIAVRSAAATLIELGSGASTKTRRLLDAMSAHGTLRRFCGFDVAEPTLRDALARLAVDYPGVELSGVVGDFERHLDALPDVEGRLVILLGGTVGNLEPERRAAFLSAVARALRPGEHLLLGTDLVKDPARLVAAYNDRAGVTARFERNILSVINTSLGGTFDLDGFDYVARWNPDDERIEMGLQARHRHPVTIADLDLVVDLAAGEEIRTEVSSKFHLDGVAKELADAGLNAIEAWTDPPGDFALTLAQRP